MRNIELGETQFITAVGVAGVVVLPVRVGNGRSSVVYRLGVSEGIRCRHVKTEPEVFLQQGRKSIAITLVCILQVDNRVIVTRLYLIRRRSGSLYTRNGIHLSVFHKSKILEEYIIHGLGVNTLESHLHITRQELFPSQIGTQHLRILELLVGSHDILLHASCSGSQRIILVFSQ